MDNPDVNYAHVLFTIQSQESGDRNIYDDGSDLRLYSNDSPRRPKWPVSSNRSNFAPAPPCIIQFNLKLFTMPQQKEVLLIKTI